jgi:hypothetical protein
LLTSREEETKKERQEQSNVFVFQKSISMVVEAPFREKKAIESQLSLHASIWE